MAFDATDSFVDVNAVVEVGELGEIVDALPCDWCASAVTGADGLERGSANPNLLMTVHASFRGRDACERRRLHGGVAVAAIDAELTRVVSVTELHRLNAGDFFLCHIRRPANNVQGKAQHDRTSQPANDADFGKSIKT